MQVWKYTLRKGIVNERDINYLQDMIVFPSNIYSIDMEKSLNRNIIECFIFSSNIHEKFSNPIFSYIEPIGDNGAYVTIDMVDVYKLQECREDIILENILANFIVSTDFAPFLIHRKALFLPANPEHLFSWNTVPGNDNKRLLRYLMDDCNIEWAEGAEICKSEDGKTICIRKDKKSAEIMINEKEEKVTLKISDGRIHDLKVRKENGKLNIYINNNLGWFWNQKIIDDVETNIERFVDYQRRINPLLFFLEYLDYEGKTGYQTEKFKNAISALKFLISRGFPYEVVIDWNSNRIINEGIKKELMKGDVDIDYQFIQGNIENRFCGLVRFALKIFIQNRERLIKDLTKFGKVYKNSSLYLFEAIKPFIDDYIPSKVSIEKHKARSKLEYDKIQKIPEPYFKYIIVDMRNKQPSQDFTSTFLDHFLEKYSASTLFGGFNCKIEAEKPHTPNKRRYRLYLYNKKGVPLLELPDILTNIKLKMRSEVFDTLKSINRTDFREDMQKTANSEFWLAYIGVLVPHSNENLYRIYKKIFDYNFGFEQEYAYRYDKGKKFFSPAVDEKVDVFDLAFPLFFDISIDKFFYTSTKLDKADLFTAEAVNLALFGNFYKSEKMLLKAGEILDADYEFLKGYIESSRQFKDYGEYGRWLMRNDIYPKGYQNYDESIKEERTTFLPHFDKKPILCQSIKDYEKMKEINNFFIDRFHIFEEIKEERKKLLHLKNMDDYYSVMNEIRDKYRILGVYKRKDLKYLEEVLNALKFKVDLETRQKI